VNAAAASPGFFREVIILYIFHVSCVCGSGIFIPDPDIFPSRISVLGQKTKKRETVFNLKIFLQSLQKYGLAPGSGKNIPDPDPGVTLDIPDRIIHMSVQ
jgi:hypothetical protein